MKRRVITLVFLALLLAACSRGSGGQSAARLAQSAPPSDPGAELVALLARGRQGTFHATYSATMVGTSLSLELWRKSGRVREDSIASSGNTTHRTATIRDGGAVTHCRQENDGPWTCGAITEGADRFDALLVDVTGMVGQRTVTEHAEDIGGRPTRCFDLIDPQGAEGTQVCVTEDGVTARLAGPEHRIDMVALSAEVPDDVFVPPATG